MFGRLKDWRRVSNRYDQCTLVILSVIALAATVIFWISGLTLRECLAHLVGLFCGALSEMQSSRIARLSFNRFSLLQNGFFTSEEDIWRCYLIQALMAALMVVAYDEGCDRFRE